MNQDYQQLPQNEDGIVKDELSTWESFKKEIREYFSLNVFSVEENNVNLVDAIFFTIRCTANIIPRICQGLYSLFKEKSDVNIILKTVVGVPTIIIGIPLVYGLTSIYELVRTFFGDVYYIIGQVFGFTSKRLTKEEKIAEMEKWKSEKPDRERIDRERIENNKLLSKQKKEEEKLREEEEKLREEEEKLRDMNILADLIVKKLNEKRVL